MGKEIFTQSFSGSIDDLLNYCQSNADFVADVIDGRKDFQITEEEAISLIKAEFPNIQEEEVMEVLNQIKLDEVKSTIESLVAKGLLEIVDYKDGEAVYGPTELGKEWIKNQKKKEDDV